MKPIRMTEADLTQAREEFEKAIANLKTQDSKLNFTYDFTKLNDTRYKDIPKPIVYMDSLTYLKMLQYTLLTTSEIAWHGTVDRRNNRTFYITDVFLYPQIVTGVTVQTDDTEYTKWAESLSAETFNTMRFQGHSHVNMGVTPSGVDLTNWNEFLQNLLDDDYYIFLIMNKQQAINIFIYDLKQNIIFEKEDIDFRVYLTPQMQMSEIAEDIKNNAKEPPRKTFTTGFSTSTHTPDYYDVYKAYYAQKAKEKEVANPTIKRQVIILDPKIVPDFETVFPEYDGAEEIIDHKGTPQRVYVPFVELEPKDVQLIRKAGWKVQIRQVPALYDEM